MVKEKALKVSKEKTAKPKQKAIEKLEDEAIFSLTNGI